ncbi:MAG: hypothetical protein LBL75_00775 [Rickettsiales bacterium]|jgi:hypothetical protein|nr:hypothetical protein [Rickettsiales bacterium]
MENTNQITFSGDGQTHEYNFNFQWFQESDIKISIDGILQTLDNYSVQKSTTEPEYESEEQRAANDIGIISNWGGRIVFNNAPASGTIIKIYRELSLTRPICYPQAGMIQPNHLNTDFNYLVELVKEFRNKLNNFSDWEKLGMPQDILAAATAIAEFNIPTASASVKGCVKIGTGLTMNGETLSADIPDLTNYATKDELHEPVDTNLIVSKSPTLSNEYIDYVVKTSASNTTSGYVWYRRYKSGWVEQGIRFNSTTHTKLGWTFPMPFADANYHVNITRETTGTASGEVSTYIAVNNGNMTNTYLEIRKGTGSERIYIEARGMSLPTEL